MAIDLKLENEQFHQRVENQLRQLFEEAKAKNELQFVFSLHPQVDQFIDPEWSVLIENFRALEEFIQFLGELDHGSHYRHKIRLALAFYHQLGTSPGAHVLTKNLLNVLSGTFFSQTPFAEIRNKTSHTLELKEIPTLKANACLHDLYVHSAELKKPELASLYAELTYHNLNCSFAEGNFLIAPDGIRLLVGKGEREIVSYHDFQFHLERVINYFVIVKRLVDENIAAYEEMKTLSGQRDAASSDAKWQVNYHLGQKLFKASQV